MCVCATRSILAFVIDVVVVFVEFLNYNRTKIKKRENRPKTQLAREREK